MSSTASNTAGRWLVCVDTGGTFTDCIAIAPDGQVRRVKVLSSSCSRAFARETRGRNVTVSGQGILPNHSYAGFTLRVQGALDALIVSSRFIEPAPSRLPGLGPSDPALELTLNREVLIPRATECDLLTGEPAPVLAARLATGTPMTADFPPMELRLATTRGTNALLEHRGGPAALFLTAGFADLLRIGTQQRTDLFAINPRKPAGIPCEVIEVTGRLSAHGDELLLLDEDALRERAQDLQARGVTCAAVALMHAWRNPTHERRVARILKECGFTHVSLSSEVAGGIGYLDRARTTLVNAYLAPVLDSFVTDVAQRIGAEWEGESVQPTRRDRGTQPRSRLLLMTSAGGLVTPRSFRPKDSLLSGPAGGAVGALEAARRSGITRVLAFDMGGTSTDVARIDGAVEYVYEHRVGPGAVVAPAVAVESVASGGGSVCWFDAPSGMFRVGPESAGADPGPACYARGGPLTITDVNLLLGRLDTARIPIPLNTAAASTAAAALLKQVVASGRDMSEQEMLLALLSIANEQMAAAMRTVSVRRGYDPREYAIVAYGGAGGQHACSVAERLDVTTVIIPRDVGLLSARGLAAAGVERFASRQVLAGVDQHVLGPAVQEVSTEALDQLRRDGFTDAVVIRRIVSVRLKGQESAIPIELTADEDQESQVRARFPRLFQQIYGYAPVERDLEVESVRAVARAVTCTPDLQDVREPEPLSRLERPGEWTTLNRESLRVGQTVTGPAIISEAHATTVLEPGWTATVDTAAALLLRRVAGPVQPVLADPDDPWSETPAPRPVGEVDIISARLTAIATDMGEMLRRTALSTNVKDRLDFSCAVLDTDGELVVNAPHIPVHLGALGLCVRLVKAALPMSDGDVVVTNHPAYGGSHLPDVTVIAPIFHDGRLLAFAASRAHHAEIGGTRPGSMPPQARSLAEEGVVIPPMHLVARGESRLEEFRRVLMTAEHPTRAVEENIADIQAQLASCRRGVQGVIDLAAEFGPRLPHVMDALRSRSESAVRAALGRTVRTELHARERMDDGAVIEVTIRPQAGPIVIDFTGSSGVHPLNLNAPLGVIRSAVMYVLRLLVDEPLPLNEGLLRAIDLCVPPGMLNPPFDDNPASCPAVAAGNVETSQRVVDTLLKAFGLAACSQGTMNNVIFGNDRFGYYETVCGGSGAGPAFHGESAVHTHMTNTRITDPEILEHRYPVRLQRFAIRRASGGQGQFHGGDGVIREFTFLQPVSLSLLTQHRTQGPYALHNGQPGKPGEQHLIWPDGRREPLAPSCSVDVPAGARLVLQTPGGGGWGASPLTEAR